MRAVVVSDFGGPESLRVEHVPDPVAAAGSVLIEVAAAGVNYADTHHTDNTYMVESKLPLVPGSEVVGRTPDGRRVLALLGNGGYAEKAVALETRTFEIPDSVEDEAALALAVQGLTAWHLLHSAARIRTGDTVAVQAAAGGTGSLVVQLAKAHGAGHVIALASTERKRQHALANGADTAIDSAPFELADRLLQANGGRGIDVVLEMTGGLTFEQSLRSLAPLGKVVLYGLASRTPTRPIQPMGLMQGSKTVIGFWLEDYLSRPDGFDDVLTSLFGMVANGGLVPQIGGIYSLSEARRAHEDLRSRHTVGKLVLKPWD